MGRRPAPWRHCGASLSSREYVPPIVVGLGRAVLYDGSALSWLAPVQRQPASLIAGVAVRFSVSTIVFSRVVPTYRLKEISVQLKIMGTWLAVAGLFVSLGGTGCSSSSSSGGSGDSAAAIAQRFEFATNSPASGWQQAQADAGSLDGAQPLWSGTINAWFNLVDGYAGTYQSQGAQYIMMQYLVGPNQQDCLVYAMDFGTDADAQAMLAYNQTYYGKTESVTTIPGYTNAFEYATLSGISVYAYSGQYYFELQLSGYSDTTTPVTDAESLLGVLFSKAN